MAGAVARPVTDEPASLPPIADYGLLGDTRTAALSSSAGSIDWLCVPRFDDQPLFGRLVGGDGAGSFRLGPAEASRLVRRRYRPGSTVLETTWRLSRSELTLTEGMVANVAGRLLPSSLLVRRLESHGGPSIVRLCFDPRRGDPPRRPRVRRHPGLLLCSWGSLAIGLSGSADLAVEPGSDLEVVVEVAEPLVLALAVSYREPLVHVPAGQAWE